MKRPLMINGEYKEAEIEYVTKPHFGFLDDWRHSLGNDTHPIRVDAVNFATLACKRYKAHAPLEDYASRQEDVADYIRNNPYSEVGNFILMRCRWFPESDIVGSSTISVEYRSRIGDIIGRKNDAGRDV